VAHGQALEQVPHRHCSPHRPRRSLPPRDSPVAAVRQPLRSRCRVRRVAPVRLRVVWDVMASSGPMRNNCLCTVQAWLQLVAAVTAHTSAPGRQALRRQTFFKAVSNPTPTYISNATHTTPTAAAARPAASCNFVQGAGDDAELRQRAHRRTLASAPCSPAHPGRRTLASAPWSPAHLRWRCASRC
jgi:hypothetical protein